MRSESGGERQPTPYADGAEDVYVSGLGSPLPLPPRCKADPPRGYTGASGVVAPWPDVLAWIEDRPTANLAVRLADGVVGIDVDAYGEKDGAQTLSRATGAFGALPPSFTSTARNDGVSGIGWYRVRPGTVLVGQLSTAGFGSHVEIIQRGHRYAVVWPSIHPDGMGYVWKGPDGTTLPDGVVPSIDDLPELPDAWQDGLSVDVSRVNLSDEVLLAPDDWPTAEHTHPYVRKVLDGIPTDEHGGDAHMWAFARACKLAAAARLGLITAADLTAGQLALVARLVAERPNRSSKEDPQREAARCWRDAAERHARMTEEQAYASLGIRPPASTTATPLTPQECTVVDDQTPSEPTASWAPIDLTGYLDGTHQPQQPTLMQRSDGKCLFYAGRTHSWHGESESGKSLGMLVEASRLLTLGQRVVMLDYESDAATVVSRLLLMGTPAAAIAEHFDYRRPEAGPNASPADRAAWFELLNQPAALVILDGVTEALATVGRTSLDNDELTQWLREVPRKMAHRTGAAVVLVDHVTKNADTRGRFAIGGQAKMAALDGAAYVVDVIAPLGVGLCGKLSLRVAKDRPGMVRPHAGAWRKSDRTQEAAVLTIDSTDPSRIVARLDPPSTEVAQAAGTAPEPFRPTTLMQRVSQAAQNASEPLSRSALATRAGGNRSAALRAVELLEQEGYLVADGPARNGGGNTLRSARAYTGDPFPPRNGSTTTHQQDPTRTSSPSVDGEAGTGTENGSNPFSGTGWNRSGTGLTEAPSRRPLTPALSDVDLAAALGDPCPSCSHRVGHRADCTAARTAA